ncbi:hypothetical protein DPMN_015491 [Dreissena polymorpha]|uniref:Uncharacterized protein n=1 Tax=Dreissena polymorpha TaxID=45954 RepID=A0A9D4S678_DREPO|nr:hypothetical protein DPMN_015491 [Dreissena polymorpha]
MTAMLIDNYAHLRGTNILLLSNFDKECFRNVNARVFRNQMWTDGRRTKTNPKTSPEQSAKNMTSEMFTRKTAPPLAAIKMRPPPGSHVFQRTGTIFKLNSCIYETNVLTIFHENWAKNATSRVFTCFHYMHIAKTAPPLGGHVFSPIWTIFELVRDINKNHVYTKFHDYWAQIVTSRVFTMKTAPPGHVFQRT